MHAIGLIEVPFFSLAIVVADRVAKAASIRLAGLESVGDERILVRLEGVTDSVQAALEAGRRCAEELGVSAARINLARPAPGMHGLLNHPNSINGLYGGRDQCLPDDFSTPMNSPHLAIGILETQGLAAVLEASDAMLKSADVTLVGKEKIGAAYVSVVIRGDVAAVAAAIDAGKVAAAPLGKVIAAHVIARPHTDMLALLPR